MFIGKNSESKIFTMIYALIATIKFHGIDPCCYIKNPLKVFQMQTMVI